MTTQTRKAFNNYLKENPTVYKKFKKYANQMFKNGRRRYSAWAIINGIRWETELKTRGNKFKINNDFIALMTRKLVRENKNFKGFFLTRPLKQTTTTTNYTGAI